MSAFTWKTVTAAATPDTIDALETLLWSVGAVSVTARDAGDEPILEPGPGETPLWQDIVVTGLFEEDVNLDDVKASLASGRFEILQIDDVPDRTWEREWLSQFRPMAFGKRLWICPSAFDPPSRASVILRLDPGLAFGTGTHPTTRLCLEWLDAYANPGMTLIDYGCGSGILGIAALLLGANAVVAVDNDPQALAATKRNAEDNGVNEMIEMCLPGEVRADTFDTVIANILAQPLVELAPRLEAFMVPGGDLVLSGIMESQVEWVMSAYKNVRFDEPDVLDGWVRLRGRRR
ncbi:MAG TPA: 50S ribosomal protein L11 methyltransferase [Pseudomonadales bacterium]|nr:50S ribosomal protein L11 methyltransferase [Pseudomonadales bacterium]